MNKQKLTVTDKRLPQRLLFYSMIIFSLILVCPMYVFAAANILIKAEKTQFSGGQFRVDITVEGVNNLYGMAFDLNYDPDTLELIDTNSTKKGVQPKAIEGSLLNNNGTDKTYMKLALEDDIPGKLVIGLSRSGDVSGISSSTSEVALSIYFRSKKAGSVTLSADKKGLIDDQNQDIIGSSWGQLALNIKDYDWTGDVNQSKSIDLEDVTLVLKLLTGNADESIYVGSDVNNDNKIGLEEGINALQTK